MLRYPFSAGDLRDSAQVLYNYLEGSSAVKIPWDDLRYIFGEIMYGGHIVDDWDRRMSQKYLLYFMRDELLDEIDMIPYAATWSNAFNCCILLQSVRSGRVFRSVQEQPSHAHVLPRKESCRGHHLSQLRMNAILNTSRRCRQNHRSWAYHSRILQGSGQSLHQDNLNP